MMRKLLYWMGWLALAASWLQIFVIIALFSEIIMAPYDVSLVRPAIGTWQQVLNDFFEVGPGGVLIAAAFTTTSVGLTIRAFIRNRQSLLRILFSNVWLLLAIPMLCLLSFQVGHWLFPLEISSTPTLEPLAFHRSFLSMAVLLATSSYWLRRQWQIGHYKAKRKRSSATAQSATAQQVEPRLGRLLDQQTTEMLQTTPSTAPELRYKTQ